MQKQYKKIETATSAAFQSNIELSNLFTPSAAQQALYLEKLKIQNDSLYNLFRVFYIKGKLNHLKLENAFKSVIAEHESLRTSFLTQNDSGLPVCRVLCPENLNLNSAVEAIYLNKFL